MAKPRIKIRTKRIYDDPHDDDGMRVLVDRLWPRGMSKDAARLDHWFRDIAPSNELRKWFGHDPRRWEAFREKYKEELQSRTSELEQLASLARQGTMTLLYGARDSEHNQAVVLREVLERMVSSR